MANERWRFIQDDSCHWYCIQANQEAEFERWVLSFQDETEDEYDGPDFSQDRLGMHPSGYTFTDLKAD